MSKPGFLRSSLMALALLALPLFAGSAAIGQETTERITTTTTTETTGAIAVTVSDLSSSETIIEAQRMLRDQGYYKGSLNGILSDDFQDALEEYQEDNR